MSVGYGQHVVPLEFLGPGQWGRVVEIEGHHPTVIRLAEMGIRAGTQLQMLRPGRPCILAMGHHRMVYRGETEALVWVELV